MSDARTNILKKIRTALAAPTPLPFPEAEGKPLPVQAPQADPVVEFAEQFSALQGKFVFCADEAELRQNLEKLSYQNQWTKLYCEEPPLRRFLQPALLHPDLGTCEAAVTGCEAAVARTGSLLLGSVHQGRLPAVYAPVHVCIVYTTQLVYDIKDALDAVKDRYRDYLPSFLTLATGPSRTADIEKTLVVGVHGPKEVYCFVVDGQPSAA